MTQPRRDRILLPATLLWLAALWVLVAVTVSCRQGARQGAGTSPVGRGSSELSTGQLAAIHPQVVAFCGDCHAVPTPDQFPKNGWADEIEQGYELYNQSGRSDLQVPPKADVLAYFRTQAPEQLTLEPAILTRPQGPVRFRAAPLPVSTIATTGTGGQVNADRPDSSAPPAVAHVHWFAGGANEPTADRLVVCDMGTGYLHDLRGFAAGNPTRFGPPQGLGHPAHVELVDLDRDGVQEMLVADLGSFLPEDHDKGRLLWVRTDPATGESTTRVLLDKVGRVTDAQAADFDQDGDLDLIVAVFGWRMTGKLLMLENRGIRDGIPTFRHRVLDDRHGCIHLPTGDLNGDGAIDFVAVFSQEHEVVEAFLNRGNGTFRRKSIYMADNPSHGSSGVSLVDLDKDGDLDVLYTNGDMFDGFYVVPYHGVHWLENEGSTWRHHRLVGMPGVHRAVAGDLDNDGDLDIAAASLISDRALAGRGRKGLDSIIWLEQTAPGQFTAHPIEAEACYHATLDLADLDRDGDLDIVVGQFREVVEADSGDVTVWWNESVGKVARSGDSGKR